MQRTHTRRALSCLAALFGVLASSAMILACGGGSNGDPDPPACVGVQIGDTCRPPDLYGSALGTDWHPDPDGDGIPTETDDCPRVYDPAQRDADGDGVGDMCDPDATTLVEDGPLDDLRAEHVTPYGAWFTLTSTITRQYGWDLSIAWSTNRADLESTSAIASLADANKQQVRVYEQANTPLLRPVVVISMQPATRYYVTARQLRYDGLSDKAGRIIEITTAAPPRLAAAAAHPRALATRDELLVLRQRFQSGDAAFAEWSSILEPFVLEAAASEEPYNFDFCLSAALLFHATGDARFKDAALTLIETMRRYWDANDLEANRLRWANATLGVCADLMWDELSTAQRNAVVAASLQDDELAEPSRMDDTDEYASIARTWITDGLIGCNGAGIDDALSSRACALLERGLRLFYGAQLVKARRDVGFFAQSGGNLPDGNGYGQGTAVYWLQTFHMLRGLGSPPAAEYAPWIWHNLMSLEIQAMTPRRRGYATFGDLDSYDNFSVEPNSLPIAHYNAGLVAMHMGLLAQVGLAKEAGYARHHLDTVFRREYSAFAWAMLLFEHEGITPLDYRDALSTAYFDSGMGMLYDRSSWSPDASYFVFRSGWSGVDHSHEDVGAFQLYRNGVWITHEALGYDGAASRAVGHNVIQLELGVGGDGARFAQYRGNSTTNPRVTRVSSTGDYTFVAADQTGAHNSARYESFGYDAVQRQILWLKPATPGAHERVIVYDLVDASESGAPSRRRWQLHVDVSPTVAGSTATFEDAAGDDVQIDVVVPAGVNLRVEDPVGQPNQYPSQVYTYRIVADAPTDDRALRFVSILRASTGESPALTRGVESEGVVGVLTGADLVVFPRSAAGYAADTATVSVRTATAITMWWAGLARSAPYAVSTTYDGATLTITVSPGGSTETDAAGLLVTRVEIP